MPHSVIGIRGSDWQPRDPRVCDTLPEDTTRSIANTDNRQRYLLKCADSLMLFPES